MSATVEKIELRADNDPPFMAEIWNTLSRVDVADHIETATIPTKSGAEYSYQYVSWSWAWATLMNIYPESVFKILPDEVFEDGTILVNVEVTIAKGSRKASRTMYLPVMDRKNNAIAKPGARNISDTRMRCLVKCLAIFGLGLDLWAKSDIPVGSVGDPIDEGQVTFLRGLYDRLGEDSQKSFLVWAGVDEVEKLPKSKYQAARVALEKKIKAAGK